MKAVALLLALSAAGSWGVGGILVKRGLATVAPETILVVQYVLGALAVALFVLARGGWGASAATIGDRWLAIVVIVVFQFGGYVFWIAAVKTAGAAVSTAAIIAIAASYPALVAVLSGPVLGEQLGWNDALGVTLVVAGVIVTQL